MKIILHGWGMNSLLCLLFAACPIYLNANADKIDSLVDIINLNLKNEGMADAFISLSEIYSDMDKQDSARFYAVRALEISQQIEYKRGIAISFLKLGQLSYNAFKVKESLDTIRIFLSLAKEMEDQILLGKGYSIQAKIFNLYNDYDSAMYYVKESLNIDQITRDSVSLVTDYSTLSYIFRNQVISDSAIFYLIKAANIAEMCGDMKSLAQLYFYIGQILFKMGELNDSQKYIEQALEVSVQNDDKSMIAGCLSQLGLTHVMKKDYNMALNFLDQATMMYRSIGDTLGELFHCDYYAAAYLGLYKLDTALLFINKAINAHTNKDYGLRIIFSFKVKGEILNKLGRYEEARLSLDSGLYLANKYKNSNYREWILLTIAQNSFAAGEYKKAYEELDNYWKLHDTTYNFTRTKIINGLKQQYEKEKDAGRILTLEKETLIKTNQRNSLFYSVLAILMVAIYGFLVVRQKMNRSRMLAQQKIHELEEKAKLAAAGKLLEGQEEERKRIALELHDGLGVILSTTRMQFSAMKDRISNDPGLIEKAMELLEQASGEARRISHNMMPGLLTKLGLFEAVEDLIEKLNETEQINANLIIDGEKLRLHENTEIMIYRVIQEMINNTLKYAHANQIELFIKISNPSITMIYTDDGIGFDVEKAQAAENKSMGLQSIISRIGFLNGEVKIESAPGNGAKFSIRIPYKDLEKQESQ